MRVPRGVIEQEEKRDMRREGIPQGAPEIGSQQAVRTMVCETEGCRRGIGQALLRLYRSSRFGVPAWGVVG